MNASFCTDVRVWMASLNTIAAPLTPPPTLVEHVSGCAHCRAALLLIVVELLHVSPDTAPITCDQCQDDLAAYIDIERDDGIAAALNAYPHVWWHLWTCVDCATDHQIITTLQDAEAGGELPPIPLMSMVHRSDFRRARPIFQAITLPRMWFTRILIPHAGPTWGQENDDTVIYEDEHDNYQITLTVRKGRAQWEVIVTLEPPIDGDVVLTLGAATFRARLGPGGVASVGPIPADLLTSPTGPAMTIMIEPTER